MQYGDMHFGELVHPLSPILFLSNLTHAGKSIKKITKPYYFSPNKLIRSGQKRGGLDKVNIRLSYNAWASRDDHVDFSLVISHSTKLVH